MSARRTLVIDGANVVGSRPDGWWRDRAGAARRLLAQVEQARERLPYDRVVLVLEGAAKAGSSESSDAAVEVVHAPHEGDDEIVAQAAAARDAGDDVTVVTADRGLRARIEQVGAVAVGPGELLRLVAPAD